MDKELEEKCLKGKTVIESEFCTLELVAEIAKTDPKRAEIICDQMKTLLTKRLADGGALSERHVDIFYDSCLDITNSSRSS